jgi:hypothetical protein
MYCATRCFLRLASLSVLLAAFTGTGWALPIFARRYETSCTTCHVVIPKLNPFGVAFRNNGYRIPVNDAGFVKTSDVALGAPGWKQLWPKAVWPGAIPGAPPIAVRVAADVNVRPSAPINLNFDFPNGINAYFAGPAGDTFSFFGNIFIQGSTNGVFIDRAYGQFRLIPETPGQNWLTLKLGRIDTRAEPFSNTWKRTTAQNFNTSDFRAFPGNFAMRDHDAGIELWGAATGPDNRGGLEYAAGVVQGTAGRPENNNFKDYYWAASYKVGGLGVVGSRSELNGQSDMAEGYTETSVSAGAFMYIGKGQPSIAGVTEDRFTRTGLKIDAWLKEVNLYGAVVYGEDELRGSAPRIVNTSAIMAAVDYRVLPWVMPSFRFEKTNFSDGRRNVVLLIPAVSLLVRANVRVLTEGRFFNRMHEAADARMGLNEGLIRLEFLF